MIYVPKLLPYFWPIFANFQSEADCLGVNSLIDREQKLSFFISWYNFRILLSNASQIFNIDKMVIFYGSLNVYTFFGLTGIRITPYVIRHPIHRLSLKRNSISVGNIGIFSHF